MVKRMIPPLFFAALSLGCATMRRGESHTDDKILRIEQSIQPSVDINAEVEQSGTVLHIRATKRCDLVEMKRIRRTTRYETTNDSLAPEMVLLAFGAIPASFGVAMIVDSKNVYEHDRQSQKYNATGPGAALGGGIALLTVGAALMAVPVVDLFRSIGSETEENEVTEPGSPIQRDVPCRNVEVMPYQSVMLMSPGTSISLGTTNGSGQLSVDLVAALPAELGQTKVMPSVMNLMIGGRLASKIPMGPVFEARRIRDNQGEDEVWQLIDGGACRTRRDPLACQQVKAFLMRFPNGVHAREALKILDPSAGGGIQIAANPEDIAKAEAAQKAAAEALEKAKTEAGEALEKAEIAAQEAHDKATKAASEACKKKCQLSCKQNAECAKGCIEEICP